MNNFSVEAVNIRRISYAECLPKESRWYDDPEVREVESWVSSLLDRFGCSVGDDPWNMKGGRKLSTTDANALHATLECIVGRAESLDIRQEAKENNFILSRALAGEAEGIVRTLTKNQTPLDGKVFARLFEWPGSLSGGAVEFYFWYAPKKTLLSIKSWLHKVSVSDGVDIHDRATFLRALGRLDPNSAVAIASDLLEKSPWFCSEVLGMFGGEDELKLLRKLFPIIAKNEEARTRRHFEAGIKKLERRTISEKRRK